MTTYAMIHPQATVAHLGFIPSWLANADATEKFADVVKREYIGGWHPSKSGHTDTSTGAFTYPEDPVQMPFAVIMRAVAGEMIFAYDSAFFTIVTVTLEDFETSMTAGTMAADLPWTRVRLD